MKMLLAAIGVTMLSGCAPMCHQKPDRVVQNKIFIECLKVIPPGPNVTKYNDWDEVISECNSSAYYQSLRGCENE